MKIKHGGLVMRSTIKVLLFCLFLSSLATAGEYENLAWIKESENLDLGYQTIKGVFDLYPGITEKGYVARSDIKQMLNDERLQGRDLWAVQILSANFERIASIDETDYVSLVTFNSMALSLTPLLMPLSFSAGEEFEDLSWVTNPKNLVLDYQAMMELFDLSPVINEMGHITRSDIEQMLNDEQLKGHQQALRTLSANFDRIAFIDETDYVSLENLRLMAAEPVPLLIPAISNPATLSTADEYDSLAVIKNPDIIAPEYQTMVELFDLSPAINEKGHLTRSDIEQMLNDEQLEDHQLRALHILSANFDRIAFIEKTDYVALEKLRHMAATLVPLLIPLNTTTLTRETITRAAQARGNLIFPSGVKNITPYSIFQGRIGDCCLISAISSYARTEKGRQAINGMIQPLNSGRVKVVLPGALKPKYIEMTEEPGLFMFQKASHNAPYSGRWASYIELAAAKNRSSIPGEREKAIKRANRNLSNGDYDALEGISAWVAIKLLKNRSASRLFLQEFRITELREKLIEFEQQEGSIATVEALGSQINSHASQAVSQVDLPQEYKKMPRNHCYSILGFDSVTQMVTIRDPNGAYEPCDSDGNALDGNTDGVFEMSIGEMAYYFGAMTVSL
ncbi:MAG: hypothetical protein ACR2PT_23565 [Endozoicomonas sp.]